MDNTLVEVRQHIMQKIQSSNYPKGHKFLESTFPNDFVFNVLTSLYIIEMTRTVFCKSDANKSFIDQMLEEKLRSIKGGEFDLEIYFQNMSELIILYYMIMGIFDTKHWLKLKHINNEPRSYPGSKNLLEYSFVVDDNEITTTYNIEIKTISCDPLYNNSAFKSGDRVVKRYFNNIDLKKYFTEKELGEMVCLENNTHYRQLSKNMKKIDNKFKKSDNIVNIGFVVIQFATSLEEFFAYLYHKDNGIMNKNSFENTDLFVFFSMMAAPDPKLNDIYESGHIFSIINDKKIYDDSMIIPFRLDNFIGNEERKIIKEIMPYTNLEYGIFKFMQSNGICLFVPDDTELKDVHEYTSELARNIRGGK